MLNIFGSADSLSSVQILLPSRRAVYALQAAFIDASDGAPLLLPKMTPIGDVEEDASDMLSFSLGRGDNGDLILPPAISPMEKQLVLTRLIERLPLAGQAISTAQAVRLAQSLGHLLDQIYQAGTMPEKLAEQMPEDLARHWQDILTFLNIIIEQWPQILQSRGLLRSGHSQNDADRPENRKLENCSARPSGYSGRLYRLFAKNPANDGSRGKTALRNGGIPGAG